MTKFTFIALALFSLLLLGCSNGTAPANDLPTAVSTASLPDAPTTTPQPLPTQPPAATNTPIPTVALPTITPLAPMTVAVIPQWETAVTEAINTLNSQASARWQLLVDENPATLLENNSAQIALSADSAGTLILQEPLVLARPVHHRMGACHPCRSRTNHARRASTGAGDALDRTPPHEQNIARRWVMRQMMLNIHYKTASP